MAAYNTAQWAAKNREAAKAAQNAADATNEQADAVEKVGDGIYRVSFNTREWISTMFGQYDEMMQMLGDFDTDGVFQGTGEIFKYLDRFEEFQDALETSLIDRRAY